MKSTNGPLTNHRRRATAPRCAAISTTGLLLTQVAMAAAQTPPVEQDELEPSESLQEVTVTASRIQRNGFNAPTPTTVISADELKQSGQLNLGQALADIPQFSGSSLPTSNRSLLTNAGTTRLDLRSLGSARTLVLIDGKRVVQTDDSSLNVSLLPFSIVERTEVVTGGASAAWGSDAVAGVVNIILDDDFQGFKTETQYGVSSRGDGERYQLGVVAGLPFADGAGNFMVAGEYSDDTGIDSLSSRDGVGGWRSISNPACGPGGCPAGQPQNLIRGGIRSSGVSAGGLILPGPGVSSNLVGLEFLPGGATRRFEPGSTVSGPFMVGGGDTSVYVDDVLSLSAPNRRASLYSVATYDISDNVTLRGDLLIGDTSTTIELYPVSSNTPFLSIPITIRQDNAFLPESVRAQMAPGSSFRLGRWNRDFGPSQDSLESQTVQATVSLLGRFANDWRWETYFADGRNDRSFRLANTPIRANLLEAIDSVLAQGVAGVADGTPICRVRITNPSSRCVPVNLFGYGAPSREALNYFLGTISQDTEYTLQTGGASLAGDLFSIRDEPVSVAIGAEWRKETVDVVVDSISLYGGFEGPPFTPLAGEFSVKEGFAEVAIPLLKDLPLVRMFELNGAVRRSDYSNFGGVTTWKAGANYEMNETVRLRGTRSRDIRAPNMSELYAQRRLSPQAVRNPFAGGLEDDVRGIGGGNTALTPEIADTTTLGVVYKPAWLDTLTLSLDWYSIEMSDAIGTLSAQEIVDACYRGNVDACGQITFGASQSDIAEVSTTSFNAASLKTSGVDFEASYLMPTLPGNIPGQLQVRTLVSYVDELRRNSGGGTVRDYVGELVIAGGVPQWRGTAALVYTNDNTSVTTSLRYMDGGFRDKGTTYDDPKFDAEIYLDLGAQQTFEIGGARTVTVYGNIRNLLDRGAQNAPSIVFHDLVGRYFTVGARVSM